MSTGTIIIIVVVVIIVIIGLYILSLYNKLVRLTNKIEEAFSTMDVYLKKRWDLIPNLLETTKGYMKHEKEVLTELTDLRKKGYDKLSNEEKIQTNEKMSTGLEKLMAVAENYPDLKANTNFQQLSSNLTKVEEDIANARKYYNGTVRTYNDTVEMFPSNIIAKKFGYTTKEMFEVDEKERENVQVKF
jgi:LemA protein